MIWDPNETATLVGKHAELYRESLAAMLDVLQEYYCEADNDLIWSYGVQLFDDLQWQQQLELLVRVSKAALAGQGDPEQWNSLEKAAFYAVYRNVEVLMEIDEEIKNIDPNSLELPFKDDDDDEIPEWEDAEFDDGGTSWRDLIADAYREKCLRDGLSDEEIESILEVHPDCENDSAHWYDLLEGLADEVLDDRDFEMASTLMDIDPDLASVTKELLGITSDYFVQTMGEPDPEQVIALFEELAELAGIEWDPGGPGDMDAPY
ncbi:hypothetical protein NHH03_09105 [Stieleria sp. TO1_6]|uniref:hypothetical protein n=1 Tax=Stieleria tagensis TaxID=2956795 RepID=UPI00209A83E7|nr:hypothetical protein [Stieleria tagensis]MCO8121892.1 hypothetical protein [Stieleria tagensis]